MDQVAVQIRRLMTQSEYQSCCLQQKYCRLDCGAVRGSEASPPLCCCRAAPALQRQLSNSRAGEHKPVFTTCITHLGETENTTAD